MYIPGGAKKRPEHSHGVMQQSSQNESAKQHVCNEQTSSNMSRNSRLQHFRSRDTNEILTRHKTMFASGSSFVVAHTQATPERHSNHQPTDQQKMC